MNFMKRILVHAKCMPERFWKRTQYLLRLEKSTALLKTVDFSSVLLAA